MGAKFAPSHPYIRLRFEKVLISRPSRPCWSVVATATTCMSIIYIVSVLLQALSNYLISPGFALAFVADRRDAAAPLLLCASRAANHQYHSPPSGQQQTRHTLLQRPIAGTDIDGQTDTDRYRDPAAYYASRAISQMRLGGISSSSFYLPNNTTVCTFARIRF